MKEIGKKILGLIGLEEIARLVVSDSALKDYGWFLSSRRKQSIDKNGDPIPWLTYPAIDFLKERLSKEMLVFEYGSGGSTIWFSNLVGSIDSVEHEPKWHHQVQKQTAKRLNVKVSLSKLKPEHVSLDYHTLAFLNDYEENDYISRVKASGIKYDLIIVDGLFRNICTILSAKYIKDNGVIILDNTNYAEELSECILYMKKSGFKRLDFSGMSPIVGQKSCTTIFYKSDNCMGI